MYFFSNHISPEFELWVNDLDSPSTANPENPTLTTGLPCATTTTGSNPTDPEVKITPPREGVDPALENHDIIPAEQLAGNPPNPESSGMEKVTPEPLVTDTSGIPETGNSEEKAAPEPTVSNSLSGIPETTDSAGNSQGKAALQPAVSNSSSEIPETAEKPANETGNSQAGQEAGNDTKRGAEEAGKDSDGKVEKGWSAESDERMKKSEANLLAHIAAMQDKVEERLTLIEKQIAGQSERFLIAF